MSDTPRTDGGEGKGRAYRTTTLTEETRQYLRWAAMAGLGLVVLVAGANFYGAVGAAIDVWVSDRYQPLIRAAFNLAVVLVAGGGIVWLVSIESE